MLATVEDVEHQRRRHGAAAARQEVFGEGPERDRLRPDAERIGAERRRRIE